VLWSSQQSTGSGLL